MVVLLGLAGSSVASTAEGERPGRRWLAGDHHVHSEFSVGYDRTVSPPRIIIGGDAIYPITTNALMARQHGLSWMVSTDHGGPNHSKVNLEQAYPKVLQARRAVPELVLFYGMEFDTPGADHSSLIIPYTPEEAEQLYELEFKFAKREPYPADPSRDTEDKMIEALKHMDGMRHKPVVISNHPSRSARGPGVYGLVTPQELRGWNDTAPEVAVGMEGAPGHQAATLNRDGTIKPEGRRGGYRQYPTHGGYDQMTARLGGFWDSMLGEGRRWWITSTSDSHKHWTEGGSDFWPGEFSKTYVYAERTHDDILSGIRNGRVFVTTGDLISELYVTAQTLGRGPRQTAGIGGTLALPNRNADVEVVIRIGGPLQANARGQWPQVQRVDVIVGEITGPVANREQDTNPTTRVEKRFSAKEWKEQDGYMTMRYVLPRVAKSCYIRVRGTNTDQLEPEADEPGEDPWSDLWFYSNPIFVHVN
jgi:hypothetical protein